MFSLTNCSFSQARAVPAVSLKFSPRHFPEILSNFSAFGLIAEEVAEVYPDLVGSNPKGEPESVRYEQINAMLLNEFLKEHKTVQELKSTVLGQQTLIAQQRQTFEHNLRSRKSKSKR